MTEGKRCGAVALIGRPNVGKSTLLNRLLGQKLAITSNRPQTTRHNLIGIHTTHRGQIVFIDTPGIHLRRNHALNRQLNRSAHSVLQEAGLILFLIEALIWNEEDEKVLDALGDRLESTILVINKVDRVHPKERLLPFLQKLSAGRDFLTLVPMSARNRDQVARLQSLVFDHLPEGEPWYPEDQISDRPNSFFAAEIMREKLTRRYGQELPYQVSVEIESFQVRDAMFVIHALIWVERDSQKGILLGKGGEALKQAASEARIAMEAFFQRKVHLETWIRVKGNWVDDEQGLARLGYGPDVI